jgi:uncharacterized protein YprB with RNaseH-like and TPR domain
MQIHTEVIFDLETQKFFDDIGSFDPQKLGVSIVSLYFRKIDENYNELEGRMLSFWENNIKDSWEYFKNANRITGFNSKRFDIQVLKPYLPEITRLPHFDILEHIKEANGKRVSLQKVAQGTLGDTKADDPVNAIIYWQKRDQESLNKLKYYCEEDVRLTKEIYDYGLKFKKLKFIDYWNTLREINVDFSYPKEEVKTDDNQGSLF